MPRDKKATAILQWDGRTQDSRPFRAIIQAMVDASILAAAPTGRWEPLTNGDGTAGELIFDFNGDVVMVWVEF